MSEKAEQMQLKAGKCDMLFKMVDSFNQNALHVTMTWHLMHTEKDDCLNGNCSPGCTRSSASTRRFCSRWAA